MISDFWLLDFGLWFLAFAFFFFFWFLILTLGTLCLAAIMHPKVIQQACPSYLHRELAVSFIYRFFGFMIKVFWGRAGVVTHSRLLPFMNNFCLYPPPFKLFLLRFLNEPHTPHFKHLSVLLPTSSTALPPIKVLIVHWGEQNKGICGRLENFLILKYSISGHNTVFF